MPYAHPSEKKASRKSKAPSEGARNQPRCSEGAANLPEAEALAGLDGLMILTERALAKLLKANKNLSKTGARGLPAILDQMEPRFPVSGLPRNRITPIEKLKTESLAFSEPLDLMISTYANESLNIREGDRPDSRQDGLSKSIVPPAFSRDSYSCGLLAMRPAPERSLFLSRSRA